MVDATGSFITAMPDGGANNTALPTINNRQVSAVEEEKHAAFQDSDLDQDSQDETEREDQYFQVDDAEPPTNYDDAYSTLPAKIKLKTIKVSCKHTYSDFIYAYRKTSLQVLSSLNAKKQ